MNNANLNQGSLEQIFSAISSPIRDDDPEHKLFSYPAKFQAHVPKLILETFSLPDTVVLDPFGGGGTTASASIRHGLTSIHYDLNPISCLVASAKTKPFSRSEYVEASRLLQTRIKSTESVLLNLEERELFGASVSETFDYIIQTVNILKEKGNSCAFLLATLLIKFLRLTGRRDAGSRRLYPVEEHLVWLRNQFSFYSENLFKETIFSKPFGEATIVCGSNHNIFLPSDSVDLIISSPPYPGVDVEYTFIQIQRRDLNRCYRSEVGVRIASIFFNSTVKKKTLCNGGTDDLSYFENLSLSFKEMFRITRVGGRGFIYCGFKTSSDRAAFELQIEKTGFEIRGIGDVKLSNDRVASSRSIHHGRDTKMMKSDVLYVISK